MIGKRKLMEMHLLLYIAAATTFELDGQELYKKDGDTKTKKWNNQTP